MDKMKAEDLHFDLEELKEDRKKNIKEREWFIDYWAEWVKTHPDKEWSRAQNMLINSQFKK
jgi:hypothetical protein